LAVDERLTGGEWPEIGSVTRRLEYHWISTVDIKLFNLIPMLKGKWVIRGTAILLGAVLALAEWQNRRGREIPPYYYNGTDYVPAGEMGRDYSCNQDTGTCTWCRVGNVFLPCQTGKFVPATDSARRNNSCWLPWLP